MSFLGACWAPPDPVPAGLSEQPEGCGEAVEAGGVSAQPPWQGGHPLTFLGPPGRLGGDLFLS